MAKENGRLTDGLSTVERLTARYAERRNTLMQLMSELDEAMMELKRRRIGEIRKAANAARETKAELVEVLQRNKTDFEDPKTRIFHGIKVGFRKLVGKVTFDDADLVVKLIKKNLPESVDILIKKTETPNKNALSNLPVNDLKKIGCSVADDTDDVVISASDSDIDKIVDALLKDNADIK